MGNAETLNIFQRLDRVRQKVSYLKKDMQILGYKAISHDYVTAETREYLIEYGILVIPRQTNGTVNDSGTYTSKNVPIIRYEANYEIDFVNIDNPKDFITVPIESHALDQGDKAPGKAISYAKKYALLKVLDIETGENDEGRADQKPKLYTEQQFVVYSNIIKSDDDLGYYLIEQAAINSPNYPDDFIALTGAYLKDIPRGKKKVERQRLDKLSISGANMFSNIRTAIETQDDILLKENFTSKNNVTLKLLEKSITDQEFVVFNELLKNIEGQ